MYVEIGYTLPEPIHESGPDAGRTQPAPSEQAQSSATTSTSHRLLAEPLIRFRVGQRLAAACPGRKGTRTYLQNYVAGFRLRWWVPAAALSTLEREDAKAAWVSQGTIEQIQA
ncbi:predicted protein [Postia placenta Mad-698-R]|nr:predicted protein [Postia placenta Mad-698-R]